MPATLLSGSAVGIYGARGDELLAEQSAPGSGFLASLGREWEKELYGQLRSCLFAVDEVDLRALVRDPAAGDDDVAEAVQRCVAGKWAGHMLGKVQFIRPRRSMSQIGG